MGRASAGARRMPRSHAFLLRCWQEPGESLSSRSGWRFCLTHISRNRQVTGFVDLDDLMAYVRRTLEAEENQQSGIQHDEIDEEISR